MSESNHCDTFQRDEWACVASSVEFTLPVAEALITSHTKKDAALVDYGCGYGRVCSRLREMGFSNVVGYDTCEVMIQRGLSQDPHLQLRVSSSKQLPQPPGSFNCVVVSGVLTSTPTNQGRAAILREFKRLLGPAGVLVMSEFIQTPGRSYNSQGRFDSSLGVTMKHFAEGELEAQLSGWALLESRYGTCLTVSGEVARYVELVAQAKW